MTVCISSWSGKPVMNIIGMSGRMSRIVRAALRPTQLLHYYVHQHQIKLLPLDDPNGLLVAGSTDDLVARVAQHTVSDVQDTLSVVNN
jgi:hypothetical protein